MSVIFTLLSGTRYDICIFRQRSTKTFDCVCVLRWNFKIHLFRTDSGVHAVELRMRTPHYMNFLSWTDGRDRDVPEEETYVPKWPIILTVFWFSVSTLRTILSISYIQTHPMVRLRFHTVWRYNSLDCRLDPDLVSTVLRTRKIWWYGRESYHMWTRVYDLSLVELDIKDRDLSIQPIN